MPSRVSKKRLPRTTEFATTSRGTKAVARNDKTYCPPKPSSAQGLSELPPIPHHDPPFVPLKGTKTSNDYLREWEPKRQPYLDVIIDVEAPSSDQCVSCKEKGLWRCTDCLGIPVLCRRCCCVLHTTLPLHRVERWTGEAFSPAWLWETGVVINLGHGTAVCPSGFRFLAPGSGPLDGPLEELDLDSEVNIEDAHNITSNEPLDSSLDGNPVLTVVDVSGIHQLPFRFCRCPGCETDDIQLLRSGFMAGTFVNIQTVFTTRVLDDFLLDNLECKTAASSYFEKLRRRTSPEFPHKVKNRYPHLLRMSRIWRNLQLWKRHGFGHSRKTPGEGELAQFCPACPQPGVNLPPDWEKDQDQNPLLYMRSFVMDGNFTANHLAQKRPEDDVWLAKGTGMMTKRETYNAHLAVAVDPKLPKHECNITRALNAQVVKTGTTATGIGATACARHGFFCPTSVVDFQKGEKHANVDYSIIRAIKSTNMTGIKHAWLGYDAICRWEPNLEKRVKDNPYLSLPPDLTLFKAIGSFHIHSHVKQCFQRYSLSLLPGSGLIDGEILETSWSVLNHISPCTRGATAAHRDEILDDHMEYSNRKKTSNMSTTLVKKHKRAIELLTDAEAAFEDLSQSASERDIKAWTKTAQEVQQQRILDVKAMDWFAPKEVKDPHRAEIQLQLSTDKKLTNRKKTASHVLSDGLRIQESQILLQQYVRSLKTRMTTAQGIELTKKREALRTQIDTFHKRVLPFLGVSDTGPDDLFEGNDADDTWAPDIGDEAELEDELEELSSDYNESLIGPERDRILLPSRIGKEKCRKHGLKDLQEVEIALRCGQANEALHNLRMELGKRAFTFVRSRKVPGSKQHKTRSWSAIHASTSLIRKWARVYRQARGALKHLGADDGTMSKYQELLDKDLKISTSLLDTSIPGQRYKSLPWFWALGSIPTKKGTTVMREFLRVHWLRAKAQVDRAREEKVLVEHEMQWTINYFMNKAERWAELGKGYPNKSGHRAYARRQENVWIQFADEAKVAFRGIID
ncbi:hypothetical protein BDN72DRAFT_550274 [Pluteus cervinus]|uniref:Uncharacterized protein n=1 Tax=Pluteus cervinus TaxID=181527 RepID=A0ACD3A342_9AGAR|nr:hypothetical protein BDN72DRAFT_550274 [Pluteus cervinus]